MLSVSPEAILSGSEQSDTLTWDFNSGAETFDYLATGETLILEYTVKATDDDAAPASDTETVTITITGTNDAPVITDGPDTAALAETDAALTATGKKPSNFLYEGHLRIAQPFNPLVAALIGFSALMLGSFSRFGVWRQIGLAVMLIILLQAIENVTADMARRDTSLWPLVYLPTALGSAMITIMLWAAGRPALFKRVVRPGAPA